MNWKLNLQAIAIFLMAIFLIQATFAQEEGVKVRSEGGGSSPEEAITKARTKAVSSQVDALVRLKPIKRNSIKKKVTKDIEPFVIEHEVVQESDQSGLYRTVLDVELNVAELVKKLVKLNLAKDFRYKPRVMIAIAEKELGEASDDRSLTTEIGKLLIDMGFKVISQESIGDVREELIEGTNPERLAEIAKKQKADILIGGNVDTKEGKKSSLLKQADLQPYIIAGSIRAAHCETGDTYFSRNFNQPQSSTSLEKARQMALKKALSSRNPKSIAKPLLTGILQEWSVQVAVGAHRSAPDLEASAPPTLKIIAPENLKVTEQASILLRALATDDNSIEGIKLWVNNVEIAAKDDEHLVSTADSGRKKRRSKPATTNAGDPEYQISRMITLAPGENKIRIAVYDSDANPAEGNLTVIHNLPEPPEAEDMPGEIQVTILTPANESVVKLPFVQLSGEAKGEERVVDVKVTVNGTALPATRDLNLVRKRPTVYKIDHRLPLQVGRNLIKLVAKTASGKTDEKYIVVNRVELAGSTASTESAGPQVMIYEPRNGLQTTQPSLNLRGQVFGENLVAVDIWVNDTNLINESNPSTPNGAFPIQQEIPLTEGENRIEVSAKTAAGSEAYKAYTVVRIDPQASPPFNIEIEAPMPGEEIAQESVRVIGTVTGKTEVGDVQVLVNQTQTRDLKLVRRKKRADEPYKISKDIHLAPGENKTNLKQIYAILRDVEHGFAQKLPGPKPAEASRLLQRIATLEPTVDAGKYPIVRSSKTVC